MKFGDKIKFFRKKMELTQKQLGMMIGFPESNADVRMAQYESNSRKPSYFVRRSLAEKLGVSLYSLEAPDIDVSNINTTMHTLFALEDAGLIQFCDDKIIIDTKNKKLKKEMRKWVSLYSNTQLSEKDSYDNWRYRYEK